MKNKTILIIEDNQTIREGMLHVLGEFEYNKLEAESGEQGLELASQYQPSMIICDYKLPGISGLGVLEKVKSSNYDCEVLIITAYGTIELAIESIKKGAFDFLTKPFSMDEFKLKIEKMEQHFNNKIKVQLLRDELSYLREQIEIKYNFGEIVGNSPAMQHIYSTIKKVSVTDTTVLIYGESGTGKELIARAIHLNSNRKDKSLVKVNCGALNENLLESELFGHERGAFTGAIKQKKGRFELANHGTLFLDEIGDISLNMQQKLLRVLQEKEFERVGGEESLKTNVRIITATNHDLRTDIKSGRFREDLFYRLYIVPIYVAPLRERKEDIPVLLEHFLQKIGREIGKTNYRFSKNAIKSLMDYHWPGNVRELENIVERALVLAEDEIMAEEVLPFNYATDKIFMQKYKTEIANEDIKPLQEIVEEVEKTMIEKALQLAHGNKAAAARRLGLKSNTLFYKMMRYNITTE